MNILEQFYYSYNKHTKNIFLKQYIYWIGSYHYNWHKEIELLLVIDGEVEVCTNGTTRILKTDDLILINSNIGHATLAKKPSSIAMVLHLDPICFSDYFKNVEFLNFECCSTENTREEKPFMLMRGYLSEMMLSHDKKTPEQQLRFESSLYSLLHTIVLNFPPKIIRSTTFMKNQKKLYTAEKMIKYINKNYRKKITLERLAKETGYNSNYVSQLFRRYFGINFYDYLTRIRLREATLELSRSKEKISEIALSNGFSDIKSFNRVFKKNFGKSPTQYRNQLSSEITKVDIYFKKIFVPRSDEAVNKKLQQYIIEKDTFFLKSFQKSIKDNYKKMLHAREFLAEMSNKIDGLALELDQTIDGYEKVIQSISEN